jgi:uncharacterized protein YcgL (UPF0745 family)
MNVVIVAYFLCAIYFAQHYTGTYCHMDARDDIIDYIIAVFWLPLCLTLLIVWLMNKIAKVASND